MRMRQISFAARKSHGQFRAGIHVAEQDVGNSVLPLAACVPCFQDTAHLIEPWHGNCAAGFENDNCSRIGCGHPLNERILIVRQRETRQIEIFACPLIGKHNGDIRFLCQGCRGGPVRAGVKFDCRTRSFVGDGFQRRGWKPHMLFPFGGAASRRIHLCRTATGDHSGVCVESNDRDGTQLRTIQG